MDQRITVDDENGDKIMTNPIDPKVALITMVPLFSNFFISM
jgi:hypothetical protein